MKPDLFNVRIKCDSLRLSYSFNKAQKCEWFLHSLGFIVGSSVKFCWIFFYGISIYDRFFFFGCLMAFFCLRFFKLISNKILKYEFGCLNIFLILITKVALLISKWCQKQICRRNNTNIVSIAIYKLKPLTLRHFHLFSYN